MRSASVWVVRVEHVGRSARGYACRRSYRRGLSAEGGKLTRQAVHDGFLFLFKLEVHLGGRHGAGMTHGYACGVDARDVAGAVRRDCMTLLGGRRRGYRAAR